MRQRNTKRRETEMKRKTGNQEWRADRERREKEKWVRDEERENQTETEEKDETQRSRILGQRKERASPFFSVSLPKHPSLLEKKKNQKQTKKIMETPNRINIHFAVVEMSDTGLRFQWMHGEMMEVNTCTETGGTSLVAFCLFLHPSSSWLENYPHSKEEEIESKEFWTRERKLASSMPFLLPLRPKGHPSRSTRTLPSFPCSEYSPPREIGLSFKSQPTLLVQGQSLVHLSRGHIAQDLLHKSHQ